MKREMETGLMEQVVGALTPDMFNGRAVRSESCRARLTRNLQRIEVNVCYSGL